MLIQTKKLHGAATVRTFLLGGLSALAPQQRRSLFFNYSRQDELERQEAALAALAAIRSERRIKEKPE